MVLLNWTVFFFVPQVTVTLKGSKQLQVIDEISYKSGQRGSDSYQGDVEEVLVDVKAVVMVPAGEGKAVSFPVIPRALGNIPITVQAQTVSVADAVKRNLLVEVTFRRRRRPPPPHPPPPKKNNPKIQKFSEKKEKQKQTITCAV